MVNSLADRLFKYLTETISETNGIALSDTLELMESAQGLQKDPEALAAVQDFRTLLSRFRNNEIVIQPLLNHEFTKGLFQFFKNFPIKFREQHIHLTGSMRAEFLFPRLQKLLAGPHRELYLKKIAEVYGPAAKVESVAEVDRLIRLTEGEGFSRYLKILYLPKLILISREAHEEAAYDLASELYHQYNTGFLRLKFSLSRSTSSSDEQVPGSDDVASDDVILGLYDGFKAFQKENSDFSFILSPVFRKEENFFDSSRFKNRQAHFMEQINSLIRLLDKYPYLQDALCEADTVGDERELYRKEHFYELQKGFRKLQYRGFKLRSHHGETWHTLNKGIQAVDNAMNIWHINTLEHGISLGINPNFYFHLLYQKVLESNLATKAITAGHFAYRELMELDWGNHEKVLPKLLQGQPLSAQEQTWFVKAKFHTAREVESYQHDVLNRLLQKEVNLVSLPSSNNKLTGQFQDYKDHPFSWWEKKGVSLGVGTDNHITLNTNLIQEMMILLFTDIDDLKITKLLMVATGETRRPYLSHLLWKMRKMVS